MNEDKHQLQKCSGLQILNEAIQYIASTKH